MSTSLNMLETFGLQAKSILQEMDECFPPLQPTPHDDYAQIMYKAGQRSVVEWLHTKLDE